VKAKKNEDEVFVICKVHNVIFIFTAVYVKVCFTAVNVNEIFTQRKISGGDRVTFVVEFLSVNPLE